jgi:hypothetical protein
MTYDDRHRFADLQRQGFMKPRKRPRKPRAKGPTVACDACSNWHEKGKHTAKLTPSEKRRAVQRPIGSDVSQVASSIALSSSSEDLRSRIARTLGWSETDARSFSPQALRDLVRPVDPALAREIDERMGSGRILL